METPSYSRRHHPPPPSPRLARSRSGSSTTTVRVTSPSVASQRLGNNRSKSTTKTRPCPNKPVGADKAYEDRILTGQTKRPDEKGGFAARFLPRGGLRGFGGGAAATKVAASAWALSPGRSLQLTASSPESSPAMCRSAASKSVGGVGGVWRYFRQKKVSPVQEEEFHRFRVLHNGLLQWRFANARAELAIAATNRIAQSRVFSVWLGIYRLRNSIMEKRIQVQRLKHEIKLYQIINPQMLLLHDWAKLDRRNQESLAKLLSTLSGISVRLPLIHGAKADVASVYEAMSEAVDAMDGIEAIIAGFFVQVERILYMVTELLITNKQHNENLEELEESVSYVATLVENETSIRAHCVQAALDSTRSIKLLTTCTSTCEAIAFERAHPSLIN